MTDAITYDQDCTAYAVPVREETSPVIWTRLASTATACLRIACLTQMP